MKFTQLIQRRFMQFLALGALVSTLSCRAANGQPEEDVEPIRGMVGVGTWATQAEFKEITVTKGNQTLYSSDFAKGLRGWRTSRGKWEVVNGLLRQTSKEEDARALIGDATWSNYTLSLKARKLSGNEGFFVYFGMADTQQESRWNIGGWGNTRHALQVPYTEAPAVEGTIETGRWYDIKVKVLGTSIQAYIDGILIHDAKRIQPEPIHGMIGVGTWGTQAEFADVQVIQGTKTIYQSNFAAGMPNWKTVNGQWQVVDGVLRQTGNDTAALALVGDPTWDNYTLTLRARKLEGPEGFLISFGSPGDSTNSWWNIGGWGNTRHALDAPGVVAPSIAGTVETGRWYNIKIEVQGRDIRAYLDGVLLHDTKRILNAVERDARVREALSAPGFALLDADEQKLLRDLLGRPVYVGRAAVAMFEAMPGSTSFARLNAREQWSILRKINRNRMTWQLGWGFDGIDPNRKQAIIDSMDRAVMLYNSLGVFEHHLTANNSPGTPTADADLRGQIRFGGQFNFRVALHELAHTMGAGTHWRWGQLMTEGTWDGQNAKAQLDEFDGAGAVLHGDRMHFWPYGLNQNQEGGAENERRHVLMVAALRRDMGIHIHADRLYSTDVPNGTYRLSPRLARHKALEVFNADARAGAPLGINTASEADDQKFRIEMQNDGSYRIRTVLPGNRILELPAGNSDNGTPVQLKNDADNATQRWYLIPLGSGWYKVAPRNNLSKSLAVKDMTTANGIPVQIWDSLENLGQQWKLTSVHNKAQ